mmetsp:Transcript_33969/g.45743  ORF Transcript_33969/g.45743 Transcript_33969/m.45743 type:complete len:243 (+) Transcript_33969:1284-2012(+)
MTRSGLYRCARLGVSVAGFTESFPECEPIPHTLAPHKRVVNQEPLAIHSTDVAACHGSNRLVFPVEVPPDGWPRMALLSAGRGRRDEAHAADGRYEATSAASSLRKHVRLPREDLVDALLVVRTKARAEHLARLLALRLERVAARVVVRLAQRGRANWQIASQPLAIGIPFVLPQPMAEGEAEERQRERACAEKACDKGRALRLVRIASPVGRRRREGVGGRRKPMGGGGHESGRGRGRGRR